MWSKQSLVTHGIPCNRPTYTSWEFHRRRERERSRENIWRNKHPKFDENFEYEHLRGSVTSAYDNSKRYILWNIKIKLCRDKEQI